MRTFYRENFVLWVVHSWSGKSIVQTATRFLIIIFMSLSLVTSGFSADIDWRTIKDVRLDDPPIDVVTSFDGSYIYILIANAVLVYSRSVDKIVNRIPVAKAFDKLSYTGPQNELVLTSTTSKTLKIIKIYPIYQINTQGSPIFGPLNAPVTVVVFDDYLCSSCAIFEKDLKDVLKMYPEEVKLVIKHYPGATHSFSKKAASAARAAHVQGKFWEFHHSLFEKQTSLDDNTIKIIARQLGLDMNKFNQDLHSKDIMSLVDRDLMEGRRLGINVTPTVFINGKYLERLSLGDITDMIEAELNKRPSS
jgi:protein-disulfide isomerase